MDVEIETPLSIFRWNAMRVRAYACMRVQKQNMVNHLRCDSQYKTVF